MISFPVYGIADRFLSIILIIWRENKVVNGRIGPAPLPHDTNADRPPVLKKKQEYAIINPVLNLKTDDHNRGDGTGAAETEGGPMDEKIECREKAACCHL